MVEEKDTMVQDVFPFLENVWEKLKEILLFCESFPSSEIFIILSVKGKKSRTFSCLKLIHFPDSKRNREMIGMRQKCPSDHLPISFTAWKMN